MPILQIHLLDGRSDAIKAELVAELTRTVQRVLGSDADRIQILLSEYGDGQWSKAGKALKLRGGTVS
jgi:4-oxalocrotonate tautomerase